MSNFLKPMGYLAMVAASVGGAGYSPDINGQGMNATATAKGEQPVQLPRPPLKIPMPLDKAGYKIDVTFEVPASMLSDGKTYLSNHFIGLRVLFTPGTSNVRLALQEPLFAVRLFLSRLENDKEVRVPLFSRKSRPAPNKPPREGKVSELINGEAFASLSYAQHSGTPCGTPDASTLVLSFASPGTAIVPGVYRFQVENLESVPALNGITAFFVYEELPER